MRVFLSSSFSRRVPLHYVLSLVLCLSFAACGKKGVVIGEVEGKVTLDGKPLPGGFVTLLSPEAGFGSSATIERDGSFNITCQHGKGMPLGSYKVGIFVPKAADLAPGFENAAELLEATNGITIPRKYQDPTASAH